MIIFGKSAKLDFSLSKPYVKQYVSTMVLPCGICRDQPFFAAGICCHVLYRHDNGIYLFYCGRLYGTAFTVFANSEKRHGHRAVYFYHDHGLHRTDIFFSRTPVILPFGRSMAYSIYKRRCHRDFFCSLIRFPAARIL